MKRKPISGYITRLIVSSGVRDLAGTRFDDIIADDQPAPRGGSLQR